jgi:hypothetical protein
VPFSSFTAVRPNQVVVLNGTAVTATGETSTSGGVTTVTSANVNPIGGGSVRLTYDGAGNISALSISSPQPAADATFDRNAGHTLSCSNGACTADNPTSGAVFVDPTFAGWNYQSFGVWTKELSSTSGVFGAISAGSPTPGSAVPLTGSTNFAGRAAGLFVDTAGGLFATASPINLAVDFGMRRVSYSTVETRLVNANTGAQSMDPGLNISGTMSYAQGFSAFNGTLQTSNGQLTGEGRGTFYGPAAEEIGGTYALQGPGVSRMLGAFGGKK